ncbi:hypothetical protein N9K40_02395 [Candidatus Pelagibacter sp.]|nr:hypothetical protein [Candidatus Pelagibacter sp.]
MHKKLGEEFDRTYRSIDSIDTFMQFFLLTKLTNYKKWLKK